MKFIKSTFQEFNKDTEKIICFCKSKHFEKYIERYGFEEWMTRIVFFVDNSVKDRDEYRISKNYMWIVFNPIVLKQLQSNEYTVLITTGLTKTAKEIINQLIDYDLPEELKCLLLIQMEKEAMNQYETSDLIIPKHRKEMIPKIIHCCWFSKAEKPIEYQKCINSWREKCPEYSIMEWNAENYDVSKNKYMKAACEKKMWAFVSDYARLDVIYNFGGIYLDMDVELLKKLDDLLYNSCFFSSDNEGYIDLGSGFGAVKNNQFIGTLLDFYKDLKFEMADGKLDTGKTIPQPQLLFSSFLDIGYKKSRKVQYIANMLFLTPEYIKVMNGPTDALKHLNGKEYAVHWHYAGWFDEEKQKNRKDSIEFWNYYDIISR